MELLWCWLLVDALVSSSGQAAQREQVTRSLKRAAQKDPASWVLVAPVHPTPDDLKWFASLNGRYPSIEMSFQDVRWLEPQLAKHPDIARYLPAAADRPPQPRPGFKGRDTPAVRAA